MKRLLVFGAVLGLALAAGACTTHSTRDGPIAFAAQPPAPDTGNAAIRECLAQASNAHDRTIRAGAPDPGRGMRASLAAVSTVQECLARAGLPVAEQPPGTAQAGLTGPAARIERQGRPQGRPFPFQPRSGRK